MDEGSSHIHNSSQKYTNMNYGDSTVLPNRTISSTQNATNAHPLMDSPISPDFPDLIPEKPKSKVLGYDKGNFKPEAHSSKVDLNVTEESQDSFESKLNLSLPSFGDYNEKLPGN